jgi:hypothetical protein
MGMADDDRADNLWAGRQTLLWVEAREAHDERLDLEPLEAQLDEIRDLLAEVDARRLTPFAFRKAVAGIVWPA